MATAARRKVGRPRRAVRRLRGLRDTTRAAHDEILVAAREIAGAPGSAGRLTGEDAALAEQARRELVALAHRALVAEDDLGKAIRVACEA